MALEHLSFYINAMKYFHVKPCTPLTHKVQYLLSEEQCCFSSKLDHDNVKTRSSFPTEGVLQTEVGNLKGRRT